MTDPYQIWNRWEEKGERKLLYTKFLMKYFPQTIWAPAKKRLDILVQNVGSGNILDAGCGTGWATLYMYKQGNPPFFNGFIRRGN